MGFKRMTWKCITCKDGGEHQQYDNLYDSVWCKYLCMWVWDDDTHSRYCDSELKNG